MAHAATDRASADSTQPQLLYPDDYVDSDDLHRLRDADSEPGLSAGSARLYGVESGGRDGAARTRFARLDVPARQYRQARFGHPTAGGDRFPDDRHRELATGELEPQYVDVGLHEAH